MSVFTKEDLDRLERQFIDALLDDENTLPAAKLDVIRKVLEKNNRLYVRAKPGDARPIIQKLKEDLLEDKESGVIQLPFKVAK